MTESFSEAFALIADLGIKLGAVPLAQKHAACWEHDVDAQWHIAVNGHREPKKSRDGMDVPPFTAAVSFNGWPAGLINPREGIIAAGAAANEDAFLAALKKALQEPRP